ncbi:hypothetical protein ACHAWO_011994 [Cyclotella atomus]|uniref:Uncharacterized protein n=1 Tax=Cyclotella atomus TaxID=382360 RepID=A0ABD3QM43_9STRA
MASKTAALLISTSLMAASAQDFPYPRPDKRYMAFQYLSGEDQAVAQNNLGYTPITWNVPGLAPVEQLGWWQFSEQQKNGAIALGFTENQWDCYINHYLTYTWSELTEAGLTDALGTLGWTQNSWEGSGDSPATESKWWGQLTTDEKNAARKLCYFQDNWNQVDMTPNNSYFPFPFPGFRYRPWDELSADFQDTAANSLSYDSDTWDTLGNNTAELNTYLNLDETERNGALDLGFYTHTWDCYMNHYDAYYWDSLYGSLLIAVEELGWTEDMWTNRDTYPDSEATFWADLTPQERAAATALCYFQESWDGEDLSTFYDYSTGLTKAMPSTTEVPADMDFSIFAGQGAPGSTWVPGQIATQQSSSNMKVVSASVTALALLVGSLLSM